MRRLPRIRSLILAALPKPIPRHTHPVPLLRPPPPPNHPRLRLPFSTQPTPLPPDAAPSAAEPAASLSLLEAAERHESSASDDHNKSLDLALKALAALQESHGGWSLPVARALRVAGAAGARLGLHDDALESLDTAAEIVGSSLQQGGGAEAARVGAAVQEQLARTKTAMGRRWDSLDNLRRELELKARFLDQGGAELGDACRGVAEAHMESLSYEKALPFCLKALEIAEKRFAKDSTEVAKVRKLLTAVYTVLGRHEEALGQNELARVVYERLGLDVELCQAEIEGASLRILLGRSEEALSDLKKAIKRADNESQERAGAYVTMANFLLSQDKCSDAKRCLEIAREILDRKGTGNARQAAEAYAEMSMIYESIYEFEMALCFLKRTLASLEGASGVETLQGSISARMGFLLLKTERYDESVHYLKKGIEMLKNCCEPNHYGLGFAYKHLAQAYLDMKQLELAVKFFTLARGILKANFGPKCEDYIDTIQGIANAYGWMESYKLAEDFQKQVVDAYASFCPRSSYDLREAERLLFQLQEKARGQPHVVFPANSMPLQLELLDKRNRE